MGWVVAFYAGFVLAIALFWTQLNEQPRCDIPDVNPSFHDHTMPDEKDQDSVK